MPREISTISGKSLVFMLRSVWQPLFIRKKETQKKADKETNVHVAIWIQCLSWSSHWEMLQPVASGQKKKVVVWRAAGSIR